MADTEARQSLRDCADLIQRLGLRPHPEGGHFAEVWRDRPSEGRGAGTAILYLLRADERSHWHRVDAAEGWHWHAGAPLRLRLSETGVGETEQLLGMNLDAGQLPFAMVPKGWWQAAEPMGGWVLVGCTVAPAFEFSGFEMAPPGWAPG